MAEDKVGGLIEAAKDVEAGAVKVVANMNEKATEVAKNDWTWNLFGVQFGEFILIFLIGILVYNIFLHKFFCVYITKKRKDILSKIYTMVYYSIVTSLVSVVSYIISRYSDINIQALVNISMMLISWVLAKYMNKLLDTFFVPWSKKKFGERAMAHGTVKYFIKLGVLTIIALFTAIVLRIGIVTFFDVKIPKYVTAFVIIPILLEFKFGSRLAIIGKNFIKGDLIQVGLDSDAVTGNLIKIASSQVILETRHGKRISFPVKYLAESVVINNSTVKSYPSDKKFFFDIHTSIEKLQEYEKGIRSMLLAHKKCNLIQCSYESGAMYRHELRVVFDVKSKNLQEAREIMNEMYYNILSICKESLVISQRRRV